MFNPNTYKTIEKQLNFLTYSHYYHQLMLIAKSCFKWSNLPNGIDEKWIEKYLYSEGRCMFFKDHEMGLMVAKCNDASLLNHYDEPTTLQPVATNFNGVGESYINGEECVLIRNNDEMLPTDYSIRMFAFRLSEISRTIDINVSAMKTPTLITCNEKQRLALKNLYKQWNGFEPVIFGSKDIDLSGVGVLKTDAPVYFDKLQIEKNHIWNECMTFLGINNANMDKRERLVDDEVQANNEQVEVCGNLMLKSRQLACEQINALFNTNISVEFRHAQNAIINDLERGI